MKVCYFGTYEKDYPRNRVIIQGLRKNGVEVVECHYPLWEREHNKTGAYLSFINLFVLFFRLLFGYLFLTYRYFRIGRCDVLMVGYLGQMDLFLAKILNLISNRPLVFNPLISLYDTLVLDRAIFKKKSLAATFLYFLDKWSMKFSDIVLLDTQEHINYLADLFHMEQGKFTRIFVGADQDLFSPRPGAIQEDGFFHVLFYGKFIPLHGIHHILHAAKALEVHPDVRFQIIGKGQLSDEIHALANRLELHNVEFIDWVGYEELPDYISRADICLGIFGDTEKAGRVIPNKVFQCLAMGKPVVTAGSEAAMELMSDKQNVLFCHSPYTQSLQQYILQAREDNALCHKLSEGAQHLFQQKLYSETLTFELVKTLKSRVEGQPCGVEQ